MQDIFLTPHFKLREFTESATAEKHGIDNTPPPEVKENLRSLCVHTLEPLREAMGLPVIITSGYRCKALNERITHHSIRSQHMTGQAADLWVQGLRFKVQGSEAASSKFKVQGCPSGESAHARDNSNKLGSPLAQSQTSGHREWLIRAFRTIILDEKIDYDQLIIYPSFIHVSYVSRERNRHGILKAQGNGKLGYGRLTLANALRIE